MSPAKKTTATEKKTAPAKAKPAKTAPASTTPAPAPKEWRATHRLTDSSLGGKPVEVMAFLEEKLGTASLFLKAEPLTNFAAWTVTFDAALGVDGIAAGRIYHKNKRANGARLVLIPGAVVHSIHDVEEPATPEVDDEPDLGPSVETTGDGDGEDSAKPAPASTPTEDGDDVDLGASVTPINAPRGGANPPAGAGMNRMSVAELKAEYKSRTGQDAGTDSVHYLRKLVLKARRGQTLPTTQRGAVGRAKVPTITPDQAVEVLKVLRASNLGKPNLGLDGATFAALVAIAGPSPHLTELIASTVAPAAAAG